MVDHGFAGSPRASASLAALRRSAQPLTPPCDYGALFEAIGEARFTLIGEASHGTHEFYAERAALTRRLILDHGCTAIAVEADWPDAYRVNRYVRAQSDDRDANAALAGFERFPAWMWRNTVVREFVEWLREYNDMQPPSRKVGFYGIDLYSLSKSIDAVLAYLEHADPEAAQRARARYACFDHFGRSTEAYGYATAFGMSASCEDDAVKQLVELTRDAGVQARRRGRTDADEHFFAQQNARLVKNAEAYYRTMFRGSVSSWNLRDRHIVETLKALDEHLAQRGRPPRIAVWAHNSHLGDASATEMSENGELNVGELARKVWPGETALIGFSTHRGSVTCASDWGGRVEKKRVRPGLPESWEALFHEAGLDRFLLVLRGREQSAEPFDERRLERAIGVIYLPDTERLSHYFHAHLARQFDAVIHIDETRALEPLEYGAEWTGEEAPETFPSGV
jgi:erythromycin esterase-like protein